MRTTEYEIEPLFQKVRYRVRFQKQRGKLSAFVVQLEVNDLTPKN